MKEKLIHLIEIILILIIVFFLFYKPKTPKKTESTFSEDNPFQIQFIDVGEADCILIKSNDEYILVDAGNNKDGNNLVEYFKSIGITKFNYVVGTHPHEDHIGGLDYIIREFDIDHFLMPDVKLDYITYTEVIEELKNKNIQLEIPKIDDIYNVNDTIIKVLWLDNKEDINDDSIVLKIIYKNTSFLLTADISKNVELNLLDKDIKSDLLKVAHHGSQYSTSAQFLNKVDPSFAVISVGKNNDYNFPKKITLDKLNKLDIKTYRTDELGTIIVSSDGDNISFKTIKTNTNKED